MPPTQTRGITTVTVNPSLDVSSTVDSVTPEHKLRCEAPRRAPGGGGVNVARVAHRFGVDAIAVLTCGGATGSLVTQLLQQEGVTTIAIPIDGETRQSFTVGESSTGSNYRFVLPGPTPTPHAIDQLIELADSQPKQDLVVVSGSLPPGTKPTTMSRLVDSLTDLGRTVIVDTSGPALSEALKTKALLVKPSTRELSLLTGYELLTEDDISNSARMVAAESTVGALLVSLGPGGALLVQADGTTIRYRAPTVRVLSAVGAGDSLVAGIATGLCQGSNLQQSISLGIAAGTAAVMTPGSQLCDPAQARSLLRLVTVDPQSA